MDFKDKNILIFGLGKFGGGVGVTKYLISKGAKIKVIDETSREKLNRSVDKLRGFNIEYHFGKPSVDLLKNVNLAVINSAIPPDHPFLKIIKSQRIPQTTEVNIFFESCQGKIIGVIGTNGKETVVKLIQAILENCAKTVFVGGNIGKSLLEQLNEINEDDYVVFELSSFQLHRLEWIKRRPEIVVYTNIQPDHLEWHGNLANYIESKFVALKGQGNESISIFNGEDRYLQGGIQKAEGRVIKAFLQDEQEDGICVKDGVIIMKEGEKETKLSPAKLKILGRHNLLNALLASAVGYVLGAAEEEISPALSQFKGIPHALELVVQNDDFTFINDSAAANPDATIAALNSFTQPIWLIAGGYDKKINLANLSKEIAQKVNGLATIGQLTDKLADSVLDINPSLIVNRARNLEKAFKWCVGCASRGSVILLSPATSSYDQFANLEQRGDIFKKLVNKYRTHFKSP